MIKYVVKSVGGGSAYMSNSPGLLSLELNALSKSPRSKSTKIVAAWGDIF